MTDPIEIKTHRPDAAILDFLLAFTDSPLSVRGRRDVVKPMIESTSPLYRSSGNGDHIINYDKKKGMKFYYDTEGQPRIAKVYDGNEKLVATITDLSMEEEEF